MNTVTRVHLGAALLDSKIPDWHKKIHLGTLDLSKNNKCILGQLFDDGYIEGYNVMFPDAEDDKKAHKLSVQHGYGNAGWFRVNSRYEELTDEWKRILYIRKHQPSSLTESLTGPRLIK